MSVKKCVERGTKLLDERRPNWFEEINVETLNIADYGNCILAQLNGGSFTDENITGHDNSEQDYCHGFDLPYGGDYFAANLKILNDEWKRVISAKLNLTLL